MSQQGRTAGAEKLLIAYATAYRVLQENTPDRALLLMLIQILTYKYEYATFESIRRHLPIAEHGLKIQIGRMKSDGYVVEESGFLRLTTPGKGYVGVLRGDTSKVLERFNRQKKKKT